MAPILLDVDGVLADFVSAACREARALGFRLYPRNVDRWDLFSLMPFLTRDLVMGRCQAPGFARKLRAYPGAIQAVKPHIKDVVFVTAPFGGSKTWAHDREQWLVDRFGPRIEIVHTGAKHLVHGRCLVDDRPENVVDWWREHPNKPSWLIDRPWNRGSMVTFRRISHVREALENV